MIRTTDKQIRERLHDAESSTAQYRGIREAEYLRVRDVLRLHISDGIQLDIPRQNLQGLRDRTPVELAAFEIDPLGLSISWPALDIDFSVEGLLGGQYGSPSWMKTLADQKRKQESSLHIRQSDRITA